jgi:glycosyltransferase involved in cell wall biosynthesis
MSNFVFIANAAVGTGLSGSDRIFIELTKRWAKAGNHITICVWEDGYEMCKREGLTEDLPNVHFKKWFLGPFKNLPFILTYFLRILSGIIYVLITNHHSLTTPPAYIYSCSDFWQDAIPACILKWRYPHAKLIGSFYLTAPNPFVGYYEGERKQIPSIKSILYWLQQQPIKFLFRKLAHIMFVTSAPDAKKFKNSIVIRGGVNVEAAKKYTPSYAIENKIYDAVYLGRFHPQKGVVELIDIWKKVVAQKPTAKLIMIGDGPLRSEVEEKIKHHNLQNNVELKGFLFDGEEKYTIYKNTKIAVHPAVYDSGGMAAAEGMAWGLPGVSFDLEALKTYYPKGMLKVPFAEYDVFAQKILELLTNQELYRKTAVQARELVMEEWDWDTRAKVILSEVSAHA